MRDLHSTDVAGAAHYARAGVPDADRDLPDPSEYADARDLPREVGVKHCDCGVSSAHCYCPGCRRRVRAPRTAHEVRWIVCHGYQVIDTDRRRFPEAVGSL